MQAYRHKFSLCHGVRKILGNFRVLYTLVSGFIVGSGNCASSSVYFMMLKEFKCLAACFAYTKPKIFSFMVLHTNDALCFSTQINGN